jgi:hypothetical protein
MMNSNIGATGKLLLVAAACLVNSGVARAETVAGIIKNNVGTVEIVRNGKTLPAGVGTKIMAGDIVKTAKDSTVGVMLKDETRMSLGANSHIALDRFTFDANTNKGNMFLSVVKGTFGMISGLLVKNNPASTQINTPTATAGVRGTMFLVEVP